MTIPIEMQSRIDRIRTWYAYIREERARRNTDWRRVLTLHRYITLERAAVMSAVVSLHFEAAGHHVAMLSNLVDACDALLAPPFPAEK